MARAGQRDTFKEARDDLSTFAEIEVSAKDVERVAETTGHKIEMWQQQERAALLKGHGEPENKKIIPLLYVSYDGTGVPNRKPERSWVDSNPKGRKRFPHSGRRQYYSEFGSRIYAEALRRGLEHAEKITVIADGARYNWDIAAFHFPGCTEIIDLYHAREHLHDLCALVIPEGGNDLVRLETHWRTMLDEGRVEELMAGATLLMPRNGPRRKKIKKEIGYFENNAHRMRYADFRAQGLFVGSGVVEAGCKTVIGKRLKQSAMKWTVRGANSIIALRCAHLSGRMESFWEQQAA